ncbi:alpha/beta-hydrolase [Sistotremastrum niveocremeum HHB9708]|uniref:triacylglycerol lipase n=1 Tax=Sistotremastrum niveocremeum HHB9708 TaxID=1314777 RepID=A0A164S4B9_9AGAM|nr:alpha/beta-hydrolase [Sistotremastrum niveocremeum HHB9708]
MIQRPRSPSAFQEARRKSFYDAQSAVLDWDEVEILGPNITDKYTLSQLARMSGNAYALPEQSNWWDIDEKWNRSSPVGWEDPDMNGFRGHVFATPDNSTIVLSIKGTTTYGGTAKQDKLNDNLLFSCCCSRSPWIFGTVCDCYSGKSRCDNTCLHEALMDDNLFYAIGLNLYNNLTQIYPESNIWLIGHSLGGAVASLLSATFGSPSVAFESPGEALAAKRLYLPPPPSNEVHPGIIHVYHTADPIPQGACTGPFSWCIQAGYALETQCHLGKSIVYDTVTELKWRVELRRHTIKTVIEEVLEREWDVPEATPEEECIDCFKWEFGEYKNETQSA